MKRIIRKWKSQMKKLFILGIFLMDTIEVGAQNVVIYRGNPQTGQYEFQEQVYQSFDESIKAILAYYAIRGLAPTVKYKENCLTEALGLVQCSPAHFQLVKKWIDDEEITEDFSTCQTSKLTAKTYYLQISLEKAQDTVRVFYVSSLFKGNQPSSWYLEGIGTFVLKDSKVEFLGENEKIKQDETK